MREEGGPQGGRRGHREGGGGTTGREEEEGPQGGRRGSNRERGERTGREGVGIHTSQVMYDIVCIVGIQFGP